MKGGSALASIDWYNRRLDSFKPKFLLLFWKLEVRIIVLLELCKGSDPTLKVASFFLYTSPYLVGGESESEA